MIGVEADHRLTLHFGLKAPGSGILEFELEPLPEGGTRLTETAYWHPQGVWGLLYWAVLVPFHLFIFKGMTRAMVRRAEAAEQQSRYRAAASAFSQPVSLASAPHNCWRSCGDGSVPGKTCVGCCWRSSQKAPLTLAASGAAASQVMVSAP